MYHGKAHVTRYRRATAKLIYIALVNQRIAYASKEVPRKMSDPELCDEHAVIRLLRCVQQREKTGYRNAQVNSKRTRTVGCLQEHAGDLLRVDPSCAGHPWSHIGGVKSARLQALS